MESKKIQLQQITQKGEFGHESILELINSQINTCMKQKLVRWEQDRTQLDEALDANIKRLEEAKQNIQGLLKDQNEDLKDTKYLVNIEITAVD